MRAFAIFAFLIGALGIASAQGAYRRLVGVSSPEGEIIPRQITIPFQPRAYPVSPGNGPSYNPLYNQPAIILPPPQSFTGEGKQARGEARFWPFSSYGYGNRYGNRYGNDYDYMYPEYDHHHHHHHHDHDY